MIEYFKKILDRIRKGGEVKPEPPKETVKEIDPYYIDRWQRLTDIIGQLNLSEKELTAALDIPEESLDLFKSGEGHFILKFPLGKFLYKLIETFQVNPDYVVSGEGEMFLEKEYALAMAKMFENQSFALLIATLIKNSRFMYHSIELMFFRFMIENNYVLLADLKKRKSEKSPRPSVDEIPGNEGTDKT